MQEMSLEEAIASVNFPVYGHTCEVLGLRYVGHVLSTPNPALGLTYNNDIYMQKLPRRRKGSAFFVGSMPGSRKMYEDMVSPPPCDPGITYKVVHINPGYIDDDPPAIFKKEDIILDGTHFIALIQYIPDPLFFSSFSLWSPQTYLSLSSHGPSLEEAFEMVKALHVLNPDLRA
jgi:hypothetical protein